jgi:dihydroflavonol-4-reductase
MSGQDASTPTSAAVKSLPVRWDGREPDPYEWPVLVTGAGGFVGGHIARELAGAGHRVRGLTRRPPLVEPGDPSIEWLVGDLRDAGARHRALAGVRGVVHAASWVCLGLDPDGTSQAINVEATTSLLAEAARSGVERFVYTSTLYTLAAGTAEEPADEVTAWNLHRVESPYTRTKRQAERLVLEASDAGLSTIAICPGMVMGPRDHKPTSTTIVRSLARHRTVVLPPGGIPIVDARVLRTAHRRALLAGGRGTRYAVVGRYLSYPELAAVVASIVGRPRRVLTLADRWEPAIARAADWMAPLVRRWIPDLSRQLVAGGFLRLHVDGRRADICFGLRHPPATESIAASLMEGSRLGRTSGPLAVRFERR